MENFLIIKLEIDCFKKFYIVLYHTIKFLGIITDCSLPKNFGGGSNIW